MNNDVQQASRTETMVMLMTIALRVLSARVVTILTLLLNTGIVAWAMYLNTWVALAGSAVLAATSWCVVNLKPPKGNDHEA